MENQTVQSLAKSLKFPSSNSTVDLGYSISWLKKGGYAGEKTLDNFVKKIKENGWFESKNDFSTTVNGNTSNIHFYKSPDHKFMIKSQVYFGCEKSYNRFSLDLFSNTTEK